MEWQKALSKISFVKIGKNIFLLTFISEFRNFKFPELENWELEVPGTWELQNFGTWELQNLGTCLRVSRYWLTGRQNVQVT